MEIFGAAVISQKGLATLDTRGINGKGVRPLEWNVCQGEHITHYER